MRLTRTGLGFAMTLATALGSSTRVEASGQLADRLDHMAEVLTAGKDLAEYVVGVIDDHAAGRPIRQRPANGFEAERIVARLGEFSRALDSVEYPAAPSAPVLADPDGDRVAFRSSSRALVAFSVGELATVRDAEAILTKLHAFRGRVVALEQVNVQLGQLLAKAYTSFSPVPYVNDYIGLQWADFEITLRGALASLNSNTATVLDRYSAGHAARQAGVRRQLENVAVILESEATRLRAYRNELAQGAERLNAEARELNARSDRLAVESKEVEQIQAALAKDEGALAEQQARLAKAQQQVEALDDRIKSLTKQRAVNWAQSQWRCPNGEPWERCTHIDLKNQWQNNWNRLDRLIRETQAKRAAPARTVGDASKKVKALRTKTAKARKALSPRQGKLVADQRQLEQDRRALASRTAAHMRLPRVETLESGNQADTAASREALATIPR
jgi:hypothetical protein